MRVMVTGAAGRIGSTLCAGLPDLGHEIVGLDRAPEPDGFLGDWHTVEATDADAVLDAVGAQHLVAIVHLAGNPGEESLPAALASHALTTAALLDAMVEHDVPRIVYGSSNHVVGHTPRADLADGLLDVAARSRPDGFYAVGKVAAEALLSLYVDRYRLDAVACRIGSFRPEPGSVRELATWLSPDDCVRMVDAALTAPAPGFAVLYGISGNTRAWWDLEPGRRLGYEPRDDAEEFAGRIGSGDDDPEVAAEIAYVGGRFATSRRYRTAFDRP